MANPRFGLYDGGLLMVFPRRLLNTAVSQTLLTGSTYARAIENILPNSKKAGSGAKRYGVGKKGSAIGGGVVIRDIFEYRTSAGVLVFLVYCSDGSIRLYDENAGTYSSLITGLAANGNPRSVAFNEKLVIADGVNPLMAYNGSTLAAIKEWVVDYDSLGTTGLASAATQTDTNTIAVTVGAGRSDYAIGQRVRVTFQTAGAVIATISAVSGSTTKTIDVSGTPFPSPSETITKVEYEFTAPAFSDIYAEHNRLWALAPGESKANTWRTPATAMRAYFTDATNNEAAWVNATLQEVGYVNLLNKARQFDELVKVASMDGYMVFFSRHQTFLYSGDNPTTADGFAWAKTIPVGCANGNMVQRYPQDLVFFTRYGARSLRRVLQTEGTEAVSDIGQDVDPTASDYVQTMLGSDANYRNARSFFYDRDGFYGFNFGDDFMMVYALNTESQGWVLFNGIFKDATAFRGTSDGRLLIAKDDQLYAYANGSDTDAGTSYSDDGTAINIRWWSPWLKPRNGRWSNVGYEIQMEDITDTTLTIYRAVDEIDSSATTVQQGFQLTQDSAYWDEAYWDEAYWDGARKRLVVRDKFLADSFWLIIQNESTAGPISFLGIKPIGK